MLLLTRLTGFSGAGSTRAHGQGEDILGTTAHSGGRDGRRRSSVALQAPKTRSNKTPGEGWGVRDGGNNLAVDTK